MDQQLQRIAAMERRFDLAQQSVLELQDALDSFEAILPELQQLLSYYDSGLWQKDYLDDEAGKIPQDMKRGVLSEDGIYDLIADITTLNDRLDPLNHGLSLLVDGTAE